VISPLVMWLRATFTGPSASVLGTSFVVTIIRAHGLSSALIGHRAMIPEDDPENLRGRSCKEVLGVSRLIPAVLTGVEYADRRTDAGASRDDRPRRAGD